MSEIYKTINGYHIYIGGTWCEVTKNGNHIYDGSVEEGMTAEEVYKQITKKFEEDFNMNNNKWIPVETGVYPDDMEDVQVTFIAHDDNKPHCEAFAYRNDGRWFWSLYDEEVKVEITAWRANCIPYVAGE